MTIRRILSTCGCLLALAFPAPAASAAAQGPNIVVIVSDDQGYGDIGSYYHPDEISTPNLDRLASRGVRLTNGYASGYVCAPTRAGLLTGRYQQRFGFYTASDSRIGIPLDEITIADVLKEAGYATGVFGKWHAGIEPPYHPMKRGFDEFYGFLGHGAHDYFDLKPGSSHNSIYRNGKIISDTGYLTDNLGREAVAFIEKHRDKPFFCYLPFNAVHWPLQAPEADIKKYNTGSENRDIYLAMLRRMDLATGAVLDTLEQHGLTRNTLVIFFSDNGGAKKNYANNGKLRDYKHSVYEGGIRVPFLVSWPGRLAEGSVCDEPVISLDVFPTICAAAGISLPANRIYDGRNMLPALEGKAGGQLHEALFWDGDDGLTAARAGRWKLVVNKGKAELYDLESDLGEQNDLSGENPEILKRLQERFAAWRKQMASRIGR